MASNDPATPSASGLVVFNELLTRVMLVTKTPMWRENNWELPKGGLYIKKGKPTPETVEELAFREVEEETGLLEEELAVCWKCTVDLETRYGPVRWWGAQALCCVAPPEPMPGDEMKAAKWWSVKTALSQVLRTDQREVLEYIWNDMKARRNRDRGYAEEAVQEFQDWIEETIEDLQPHVPGLPPPPPLPVTRPLIPRAPSNPPEWLRDRDGAQWSVPAQGHEQHRSARHRSVPAQGHEQHRHASRSRSPSHPRLPVLRVSTSGVNNRGHKICAYFNSGACNDELAGCSYGLHVCNWVLSDGTVCSRDHACVIHHAGESAHL